MQTREADGLSLRYLLVSKGQAREWSWTGKKIITWSESRRYRVAGRLEVRAGRMVRQAGMESRKTCKGQNRED